MIAFITTLKQNVRSLDRNKFFTVLNLCGFTLGLAASMILALYVYREYNVNKCFPNHENIYLLANAKDNNVPIDYDFAALLKDHFPEVEDAATFGYAYSPDYYLRNTSDNEFITGIAICYVTNDFFRLFSVKTLLGDPQSPFTDDNSAVITASLAQKLFGRLDVIDETVDYGGYRRHTISAVVEDIPENSNFPKANFFVNSQNTRNRHSISVIRDVGMIYPTPIYVQLTATANPDNFIENVNSSFLPAKGVDSLLMIPLAETYMTTELVQKETESGNPILVKIFIAIRL